MKALAQAAGLAILMASAGSPPAAEQTVSEHTATFTVRPGELKMERAQLVSEKIKRLVNRSGNNPLNPSNPLIDPSAPTTSTANLASACVGSVWAGMNPITEAKIASIELDAGSGACQLRSDYTGTTLRLSDPPSEPPLDALTVDAYPVGAWAFVAPSPVGGKLRFPAGTVQTVRLRAPTGAVIDMQFRFAVEADTRRLYVLSTTPVQ